MFRFDDCYKMDMSWDDAVALIKGCGCGDLLKGLEDMNQVWDELVMSDYMSEDKFYDDYIYEVNAFNIVYEGMAKLFEVKDMNDAY